MELYGRRNKKVSSKRLNEVITKMNKYTLWYKQPAERWLDGLPIGIGILLLLLLSSELIIGCQTKHESNTQDSSKRWGEPSNGIRCSIIAETTHWSNGEPAIVSIAVENISEGKVDLKTIPAFTLNEMQYWCPVDIAGDDHSLPANARSNISLEKGAQINSKIDISKLKWDQGISSIWPSKNLYSIVPTGKYKLRLDIEVVDGSETQWIRSNEVSVEISEKI
jgi:hypothetical protein